MNGPRDGVAAVLETRERMPIFTELSHRDPLGRSWLSDLNKLGGRSSVLSPGDLIVPPFFEFPAPPPRDFLAWLVSNPERLRKPNYATSLRTPEKRESLIQRNASVRNEALAATRDLQSNHHRK